MAGLTVTLAVGVEFWRLHVANAISYDTVPVEFDQLFNASEKRLARTLLLLARFGKPDGPRRVLPKISQESVASR